jgi:hypothetical protein
MDAHHLATIASLKAGASSVMLSLEFVVLLISQQNPALLVLS